MVYATFATPFSNYCFPKSTEDKNLETAHVLRLELSVGIYFGMKG